MAMDELRMQNIGMVESDDGWASLHLNPRTNNYHGDTKSVDDDDGESNNSRLSYTQPLVTNPTLESSINRLQNRQRSHSKLASTDKIREEPINKVFDLLNNFPNALYNIIHTSLMILYTAHTSNRSV